MSLTLSTLCVYFNSSIPTGQCITYAGNKEAGRIHASNSAGEVVVRVPPVVPRNNLMFLGHTEVMTQHYSLRNEVRMETAGYRIFQRRIM
jgi:hypothetical protein